MYEEKTYYVYILANNRNTVLYIGVTNNLERRLLQHKGIHGEYEQKASNFTRRYNVDKLIYYELFYDIEEAIHREKELKGWRRSKKINLIESVNPEWKELFDDMIFE